jgi:hypothetical protein
MRGLSSTAIERSRLSTGLAVWLLTACTPSATIGMYTDGGARCSVLMSACPTAGEVCQLSSDPREDACRPAGVVAFGSPCTAMNTCVAGAQCASLDSGNTRNGSGTCMRICAHDTPMCAPAERCASVLTPNGDLRLDYGLCTR